MFIHAAADEIRAGRLKPSDLLERCLHQIDRFEKQVRAWVLIDRIGARQRALRCDEEIAAGQYRGPLHGIPVGIKDIIDVFDWPTAAGSKLWKDSIARQDATCVARLRAAGAVLVGKTVTTQYASFDPPPTQNPWNRERTPGGSSSGSAAAVACGMCLAALASQTGGSITRPAAYCGVASIKPTYGRVSTQGVVPLAPSMDHIGVMAGCVRDLGIVLQTIAGADPQDRHCSFQPVWEMSRAKAISPPHLAILGGLFEREASDEVATMMRRVTERLANAGARLERIAPPTEFDEVLQHHRRVMAVEAAAYHEERLRKHPDDYGPCITSLLREGLACPAPTFAKTKEHQRQLRSALPKCLTEFSAFLVPAATSAAPSAATTGDPAFNSPWSYTGLPTMGFVADWTDQGLPLGVQVVGLPFWEHSLIHIAEWCVAALALPAREPRPV